MNKPIAVLISDVHYSLSTLELADVATQQAVSKANELQVPLIIAGDLHDTKANMRAECVNALLETLKPEHMSPIYVLRGNHDSVNEKSKETGLDFLEYDYDSIEIRHVVKEPEILSLYTMNLYLIPYFSDVNELKIYIKSIPKNSTLIMHQGLQGSDSGEYIKDYSALTYDDVKDFRVISGHYHNRQDIKTGQPRKGAVGLFSYIGNPYSLNFGEANHLEKGFQILMNDGTLDFVPTNLPKHIVIEHSLETGETTWSCGPVYKYTSDDHLWLKVTGTKEQVLSFKKDEWLKARGMPTNTRFSTAILDLDTKFEQTKEVTQHEILEGLIESKNNLTDTKKQELKQLYKRL